MKDLPWLRLYTDTVDNEKLRLLAFEDRWHYIALLCLKQQGIIDSDDDIKERLIAVKLGVQLRELDEIKRRLTEVNLITQDYQPTGWEKHQYKSDCSTNRVRKHRKNKEKKQGNVTGTLQKRKCNVIDTDTDTDTDLKIKTRAHFVPPSLHEVKDYCLQRKNEVDPQSFLDHYEANGWMRGKTKIKSWQACVRTWEASSKASDPKFSGLGTPSVMTLGKQKNLSPRVGESMDDYTNRVRTTR